MKNILIPPIALIVYGLIGTIIFMIGKKVAPPEDKEDDAKRSLYGSGEAGPQEIGIPGYKPFLLIALFFAMLHLGVLVVGTSNLSGSSIVYLSALIIALLALMLG